MNNEQTSAASGKDKMSGGHIYKLGANSYGKLVDEYN